MEILKVILKVPLIHTRIFTFVNVEKNGTSLNEENKKHIISKPCCSIIETSIMDRPRSADRCNSDWRTGSVRDVTETDINLADRRNC